jgi:ABC-type Fe3+/spermidine/putrescine transport system ATPase subunit
VAAPPGSDDAVTEALTCRDLGVQYGEFPVLDGFDLDVTAGEVVALLGPSGSGKTSVLNAVAGVVPVASGEIRVGGLLVASASHHAPPERRSVAMAFQHYALWPHLSALETAAYPLRRAGVREAEALRRSVAMLDRLGLAGLGDRRPSELSGGQQQRVGLARALIREDVAAYLLDEPTAHLDADLGSTLQDLLAELGRDRGAGVVYASHDPAEALGVADRVALVRGGRVVQQGSPADVYSRPIDRWAAGLTGKSSLLDVDVRSLAAGRAVVRIGETEVEVGGGGEGSTMVVRPEWAHLGGSLSGVVRSVRFRGSHRDVTLDTAGGAVVIRASVNTTQVSVGETLSWGLDRGWLVSDRSTRA